MHELSIATNLLNLVTESLQANGGGRVRCLRLKIGRLASVHEESLRFSFDLVKEGTLLAEASLEIDHVPVTIFCQACQQESCLEGIQSFRCLHCQQPCGDIRQGRELDLESIEFEADDSDLEEMDSESSMKALDIQSTQTPP